MSATKHNQNALSLSIYLSESDIKRFWSKVGPQDENGCREWTAHKDKDGYGTFRIGNRMYRAHRVVWFLENGSIPFGKSICHKCDNPSCQKTDHFFLGSHKDNMQDMFKKGRGNGAFGDRNGSRLHPEKLNPIRGEKQRNSKLTESSILAIKNRCSNGETQRSIAKDLGVSFQLVSLIVNGKRWVHV